VRTDRRRPRTCPGCGGGNILRGSRVEGVSISLVPPTEDSDAVVVPAYSDVCYDCGMVTLFARIGHQVDEA
jgi:hypothetical protein